MPRMTAAVGQVTQNWDDLTNNISVVIHVKWDMKQGMYPSYETSIIPYNYTLNKPGNGKTDNQTHL